jgi:hypothetical protein
VKALLLTDEARGLSNNLRGSPGLVALTERAGATFAKVLLYRVRYRALTFWGYAPMPIGNGWANQAGGSIRRGAASRGRSSRSTQGTKTRFRRRQA